jgi:hypothetical protein
MDGGDAWMAATRGTHPVEMVTMQLRGTKVMASKVLDRWIGVLAHG